MSKKNWEQNFNIGDYEPRRSSRARVEPTEEDHIAHCLDFIKINLDAVLYNQYTKNLNNQDFVELLRIVDSKIMPKLLTLLSSDEEITEVRNYLIAPIQAAANNGNRSAILALHRPADPTLYVIDTTEYSRKAQKIFEQNSDLLQNIGIGLNTNNAELFHDASRYLISRTSIGGVSEDEQLKLMNQLEHLSSRFSIGQEVASSSSAAVARPAFSNDISDSISSEIDSTQVATMVDRSIAQRSGVIRPGKKYSASVARSAFNDDISDSISSEIDSTQVATMVDRSIAQRSGVIEPGKPGEKYDEEIREALIRNKNLLGLFNVAIADRNYEKVRYYGEALRSKLQEELPEEKYRVILHDMADISREIRNSTNLKERGV